MAIISLDDVTTAERVAARVCPVAMERGMREKGGSGDYIASSTASLSNAQGMLVAQMCLSYSTGFVDGIHKSLEIVRGAN